MKTEKTRKIHIFRNYSKIWPFYALKKLWGIFLEMATNLAPQHLLIHPYYSSFIECMSLCVLGNLSEWKKSWHGNVCQKTPKNALFPTLLLNLAILPSKNNFLGFLTPDSNFPQFFAYSHHISMILCDRLDFDHFGTQMIPWSWNAS